MRDEMTVSGGGDQGAPANGFALNSLCGMVAVGLDGNISHCNEVFLAWTGYDRDDVIGKRGLEDFLSPGERVFFQGQCQPMLQLGGAVCELALRLVARDGTRFPVLVNAAQRRNAQGKVVGADFTVFNASERRRYEDELRMARQRAEESDARQRELNQRLMQSHAALHAQTERLRLILGAIGDGVVAVDGAGTVSYMNPAAAALCACDRDAALGMPLSRVFSPVEEQDGQPFHLHALSPDATPAEPARRWVLCKDRDRIPVTLSVAPMRDEAGGMLGHLIVFRDVSASQEFESRLHYLATHDALTQLINRHEFERRLSAILQSDSPAGHTLMYLDLDQFKIVNDTCGHAAGDELMRQLAHVMRRTLRKEDTLARLGGDEFGVLLHRSEAHEALAVAERLRQALRAFDFVWGGKVFPIGVSIGLLALLPGEMLLCDAMRIADSACYVAKEKGRNRVHVSTRDDLEVERHKGEVGWISRLHAALKDERFVLFGQQIRALQAESGAAGHVEVLIRMTEADGTLVSPMAFIPSAERYGIMPQIDRWVIGSLLRRFHELHPDCAGAPVYAVNLSGTTLCDEGFLPFVREELARWRVDPARICFEVTETAAIANLKQATHLITELKALGCRFSLDDFGSGMSSFGYLKHLAVDFIKIDGRFVKDLLADRVNYTMVEAIHRVGHVMGLRTIAEFVENAQVLEALRGIGVDFAQGYEVHRPAPLFSDRAGAG
ncbi:EAL domain-containing protein [Massilia alkalitolerans]|uniref:EAL domain-containing protein n=1 Tax=Massilia alkalitolerans TaxID=286638 RepID=UPI00041900EE|nr:EAL domain-containing protein [Massilia alkalitolerans]